MPCPLHSVCDFFHPLLHVTGEKITKTDPRLTRKMLIPLSLLFFLLGSTPAEKQGNFGIFAACTYKNSSLRLTCQYANCSKSPPFNCEIKTSNSSVLLKASNENCWFIFPDHRQKHGKQATNYTCTLIRKKRREEVNITIDYSIHQGKNRIKPCRSTTDVPLHPAPALLWPVVTLSLWRVLITDDMRD